MSIGMDNTTKTINQPLVRNRSKTTLGEVVGKVGILSKPPGRKQTHTLPAQGNRNTCWTFHTGQSEEDYIGDLPDRVHSCVQTQTTLRGEALLILHPVYDISGACDLCKPLQDT